MGIVANSLSLFLSNFIYLISFYLGCVIFVYSEKKDRQAVFASISFFTASLFFIGHLLILGKGMSFILSFSSRIIYPSFFILSLLPFAWSSIVFRFYEDTLIWNRISLRKLFILSEFLFFLFSSSLVFLFIPESANSKVSDIIFLIPDIVFFSFSFYIFFCTTNSIIYLLKIKTSQNNLEEIAKSSAYRTILHASLLLVALSVLVGVTAFFGRETLDREVQSFASQPFPLLLLTLDCLACLAILATILIVGKAVISYQVFTGRYLAMKSLKDYWKYILFFVVAYSLISSISGLIGYTTDSKQILLSVLGLLFFVKIQIVSRTREIENRKVLKPFLFNENLYESITQSSDKMDSHLENTFRLLCDDTLATTRACLVPMGAYASYIPKPLFYPDDNSNFKDELLSFTKISLNGKNLFYLNRDSSDGYVLALTILDSNGLVGVLFLGVKKDYTLYSEEEIDIARIGSGKILDLLSVTEISRLLVNLQKKQLMDSKLLDHQTRRVLHDDILPEIHTIMIGIDSMQEEPVRMDLLNSLSGLHKKISNLLKILPFHPGDLTYQNFILEIKSLVKSELPVDSVFYFIQKEAEEKLQALEPIALEVVYYAVRELLRNILRYAIHPDRKLEVKISLLSENSILELCIEDNGKGLQNSTKSHIGAGQGLILHSTMMAVIGGALIKESQAGEFTRVRLVLKKFFL